MDIESSRTLSRKLPRCACVLGVDTVTTPAILRARGPSPDRELLTVYATLSHCDIRRMQLLSVFPGLRQENKQQILCLGSPALLFLDTPSSQ